MKRFQQVCFAAIVAAVMMAVACTPKEVAEPEASKFITVEDGQFIRNGKPYYFVGTNFWYGAILASEGQGGDRERLAKELEIDPKETIAIGDSPNDGSMIGTAGLGLAVKNACEELQEIAKGRICSNEEHVAKYVLEKIIL